MLGLVEEKDERFTLARKFFLSREQTLVCREEKLGEEKLARKSIS